jgi:hypothetical protein
VKTNLIHRVVVASLALSALATPSARADSGPWTRWKQDQSAPPPVRHVEYVRADHSYSPVVPALIGLIGGIAIGSQLHPSYTVVQPACPPPVVVTSGPAYCPYDTYRYYDPYSQVSYVSLDDCYRGEWRYDRPIVVQQIDVRSGYAVATWSYGDGGWRRGHGNHWGHYKHWHHGEDWDGD